MKVLVDAQLIDELYYLLKNVSDLYALGFNECAAGPDGKKDNIGVTAEEYRYNAIKIQNLIRKARNKLRPVHHKIDWTKVKFLDDKEVRRSFMLPEDPEETPKNELRKKIVDTLNDDYIPAITLQVTPEHVRIEYNLTEVLSVESLAGFAALFLKGSNDVLHFMYMDSEKAGVSPDEFHQRVKEYLEKGINFNDHPDSDVTEDELNE